MPNCVPRPIRSGVGCEQFDIKNGALVRIDRVSCSVEVRSPDRRRNVRSRVNELTSMSGNQVACYFYKYTTEDNNNRECPYWFNFCISFDSDAVQR